MQSIHRLLMAAASAVVLAACSGPPAGPKVDPAADEAAVRAMNTAWYEAYAKGDAATMSELYADDAVMHPPGAAAVRGRAAIREFIAQDMAASQAAGLTIANDSSVDVAVGVSGDLAWTTNGYVVTAADGSKVDVGKSVTVMARRGDGWKTLQEQWNSNSPAAVGGKVLRIVRFTSASADAQKSAMKLVDEEINPLYANATGFRWVKYFIDDKTLETGSVSAWDSAADVDAFLQSDGYKPIPGKLKPLMKGSMVSSVYEVHEPAK